MTKAELTARVAGQLSLTKTQTERIVDLFFSSIVDALQRGPVRTMLSPAEK